MAVVYKARFSGIGTEVVPDKLGLRVTRVFPGTPAVHVTLSWTKSSSRLSGSRCGPDSTGPPTSARS